MGEKGNNSWNRKKNTPAKSGGQPRGTGLNLYVARIIAVTRRIKISRFKSIRVEGGVKFREGGCRGVGEINTKKGAGGGGGGGREGGVEGLLSWGSSSIAKQRAMAKKAVPAIPSEGNRKGFEWTFQGKEDTGNH